MPIQESNRAAIYHYLIEFVKNNTKIHINMYQGNKRNGLLLMSWAKEMDYSQPNDDYKYITADDLQTIPINQQTGLCFGLIEFRRANKNGATLVVYEAEQFQIKEGNGWDKVHEFCHGLNAIANDKLLLNDFSNTSVDRAVSLEPIQDINRNKIYNYLVDFTINHEWIGIDLDQGNYGEDGLISWEGLHSKEQRLSRLQQLKIKQQTGLGFERINIWRRGYIFIGGIADIIYNNGRFELIGFDLNCRFDRIRYLCAKLNALRTDSDLSESDSQYCAPVQRDKCLTIYSHLLNFAQNNSNIRIIIRQCEDYDGDLTKESAVKIWNPYAAIEYAGDFDYQYDRKTVNLDSMKQWDVNQQTGLCFKWIDLQQSGGQHEIIEYDRGQFQLSSTVGGDLSKKARDLLTRLNVLCVGSELLQGNDTCSSSSSSSSQSSNIKFFPPSSVTEETEEEINESACNIM